MFETELETRRGARKKTKVFVVQGFRPEPLMGDQDAAALGFITFNPWGREATEEEKIRRERETSKAKEQVNKIDNKTSIPDKICQGLGVQVLTTERRGGYVSRRESKDNVFNGRISRRCL